MKYINICISFIIINLIVTGYDFVFHLLLISLQNQNKYKTKFKSIANQNQN